MVKRPAKRKPKAKGVPVAWKHNAMIGHAVSMRKQLYNMLAGGTLLPEAVKTAEDTIQLVIKLENELRKGRK